MASPPATPDLSSHIDPISGKPEKKSSPEPHFVPSQLNPVRSAQHHSRRTSLPSDSRSSDSPATSDDRTSPGLRGLEKMDEDVPGAFPSDAMLKRRDDEQARAPPPPSTVDEVKHAVEVLGDYAKLYLPTSVGAYIGSKHEDGEGNHSKGGVSSRAELPSKEDPSDSRVGVGSLPGKTSEPAVAALPEEKAGKRFNMMTIPDSGPMSWAQRAPFPLSDKVSVPSGGVGSLPGTPNEVDVARLPEERLHAGEIASLDSHAPLSAAPMKVSQEFPLPQRPSKVSTNPFRNGQFGTVGTSQDKPATTEREGVSRFEGRSGATTPGSLREHVGSGHSIPAGIKEPRTTPEQRRTITADGHGVSREPSMAMVGGQIVSGEELESLLEKEGVTSRSMLRDPESAALSEGSSAQMLPGPLDFPGPCDTRIINEPSAANIPYSSTEEPPLGMYSPIRESVVSDSPHTVAPAAKLGDVPTPARETVIPEVTEPPVKTYTGVEVTEGEVKPTEGRRASNAGTAFGPGTGVGASVPIVPLIIQESENQHPTRTPLTPAPAVQPSAIPSSSETPSSARGTDRPSKGELMEKETPDRMKEKDMSQAMGERAQGEPEEVKEKPKGLFPRISEWFHHKKSKSPDKRDRDREQGRVRERERQSEGSEDLEVAPEHEEPEAKELIEMPEEREPEQRTTAATSKVGAEETLQPTLIEEDQENPSLTYGQQPPVVSVAPSSAEAAKSRLSRDAGQPPPPTFREETLTGQPSGADHPAAFVGAGTLPHQSRHQGATAGQAPSSGHNLYRPPQLRSRSHPGGHSPIIPKHVPAHFDETIGPLPEHVEKRSAKELPSREKPGGSRVGIGSLPGDEGEEGVALAPDERFPPPSTIIEVKSGSIPHTPVPEGVPSTSSGMGVNVPPASNVAFGIYGSGVQPTQLTQPSQAQPVSQQRQLGFVPHALQAQPAAMRTGTMSQPQENAPRYSPHAMIPPRNPQDCGPRPRLTEKEAQTIGIRSKGKEYQTEGVQTMPLGRASQATSAHPSEPHAPEAVRTPGSVMSLFEHARQEEQERLREIESGQRKTIFTAGERRRESTSRIPVPSSQQQMGSGRQERSQPLSNTPATGFKRHSPPRTGLEAPISFRDTPHHEPTRPITTTTARDVRSTSRTPESSTTTTEQRSLPLGMESGIADSTFTGHAPPSPPRPDSPKVMPEQRSVPLGMETGIADTESASTSAPYAPPVRAHAAGAQPTTSGGAQPRHGAQLQKPTRKSFPHESEGRSAARRVDPAVTIRETSPATAKQALASVSKTLNDVPTPLEMSSHPSRSSFAENVKPPRAPFSTHERISGQPSDVVPAVREQYLRSIAYEPGEMVGTGGSLPGYLGPAALSALIGERIYDEHMRVAGAGEPIRTTANTLERQLPVESQAPLIGPSVTERATAGEQPDFTPVPPTSHLRSTIESRPTNTTGSRALEHAPRTVSNISTTAQLGPASEFGSPLTSAPVRGVDLSGGIGISSLSGQPATSSTRLRSTLNEEVPPRTCQAVYPARELRSPPAAGKGLDVDELGAPTGPGKKDLKQFLDEQISARKASHN
ncbi:hypothetical protein D9756_007797 [Leucocoprinus leucothites]|uniref:Uncharacterized protein n=1 Tax=Leucocoprinus leucothites TaxID=201217 RepID=A0A8H5D4A5_9AGAR|nr:hypothetical protein D9756_007797 [Leucoagaricus leucothites]